MSTQGTIKGGGGPLVMEPTGGGSLPARLISLWGLPCWTRQELYRKALRSIGNVVLFQSCRYRLDHWIAELRRGQLVPLHVWCQLLLGGRQCDCRPGRVMSPRHAHHVTWCRVHAACQLPPPRANHGILSTLMKAIERKWFVHEDVDYNSDCGLFQKKHTK